MYALLFVIYYFFSFLYRNMASSPQVNPVKKEKKIITSEASIQTLQSQGHLCEISEMLDDLSEHIGVQQLCNALEELKLITNMTGTLHQKL